MKDAIHQLRSRPEFLEVLRLQLQLRDGAGAPAPPQVHPVLVSAEKKSSVEGMEMPKFKKLRKCHTFENDMYGLQNMEQYNRLTLYLQENGDFKTVPVKNRGDCLFASVRRCIYTSAEYTNTHLKRQMVMCLIEHKDFFWPLLKKHLRGNYGHVRLSKEEYDRRTRDKTITDVEREDYLCPGPFCLTSYLETLSKPSFWGDEMVIIILSMMWQVEVTIVKAETLYNIKFRHNQCLSNSDILLVHCSGQHYVAAGEPSLILTKPVQCNYSGAPLG